MCEYILVGASPQRTSTHHHFLLATSTITPKGVRRFSNVISVASDSTNEGEGKDPGATTRQPDQGQTAPTLDGDVPVFYIKGLEGGIGVGAREDDADEEGTSSGVDTQGSAVGTTEDDTLSVWDNIRQSLGLGPWSYFGLGLALVMITLNNVLGLGWLGRVISPDSDAEGLINIEGQQPQIRVIRLDDPSNLLPP